MGFFKHEQAIVSSEAIVGDKTRVWAFSNVQAGVNIGRECNICDGCFLETGTVVGDYVTIKNNVALFDGVVIEDEVFIGAFTAFINDRYPRSHRGDDWSLEKTLVKKSATLGANSTIMCGVTIGEFAVVGAGAVVTKDVAPYTIVCGNPARPAGFACECGRKLNSDFECESCKEKYALDGKELKKV